MFCRLSHGPNPESRPLRRSALAREAIVGPSDTARILLLSSQARADNRQIICCASAI